MYKILTLETNNLFSATFMFIKNRMKSSEWARTNVLIYNVEKKVAWIPSKPVLIITAGVLLNLALTKPVSRKVFCVLNKCYPCVYFTFDGTNKGFMCLSKKGCRGTSTFRGNDGRLEQLLKKVQSCSGSLVSLLDTQLCSSYGLLLRVLMRLSPHMFLLYLS